LKLFTRLVNKKRAISPVISVILLIGLAVAAVAAIFLVVLPLLETTTNLQIDDAYVEYDDDYTTAADAGEGFGKGTLILSNAGTGEIEIVTLSVYYSDSVSLTANWTKIDNHDKLGITTDSPHVILPLAALEELTVRFQIPDDNDDKVISYRITITTDGGDELDTARLANIDETEMQLEKDIPDISFTGTLGTNGYIRRTITDVSSTISYSSVSDNSEIKNVTYQVYNATWSMKKTITSSPWKWNWATYDSIANGTYNMTMTVNDYAGLSAQTGLIDFIIDNDYVSPTIWNVTGTSRHASGEAEVGDAFQVTANITDSGNLVSSVSEAYIYYKLNDSSTTYTSISMSNPAEDEIWEAPIPAIFFKHETLVNNFTYYIKAGDGITAQTTSSPESVGVIDTVSPNFDSHEFNGVSVISQTSFDVDEGQGISISVGLVDEDLVGDVNLVWRQTNDTTILDADPWYVYTNVSGTGNVWDFLIPSSYTTLEGIEYYLNATDPTGNIEVQDATGDIPYKINIDDEIAPTIVVTTDVPSSVTEGDSLSITVKIADNDPSFSWWGNERGTVEIGYMNTTYPVWVYTDMIHTSGDSSLGEEAIWEATIPPSVLKQTASPIDIRVRATDNASQTSLKDYTITVIAPGVPSITYIDNSVDVSGTYDHILRFDINNSAGGFVSAKANITDIEIVLLDNTKGSFVGIPYAIEIDASASSTHPIWTNSSYNEGENGSKINLVSPFDLTRGSTSAIWVTYANDSGSYFNVNDLTVHVTIYYNYGVSSSGSNALSAFDTPITTATSVTETRHMREDSISLFGQIYNLWGTSQSSNSQTPQENHGFSIFPPTITWGIRVYILDSSGGTNELTSGMVATVERSSTGGMAEQQNTWNCPGDDALSATDRIYIEVFVQEDSGTPVSIAKFITEELGATKLLASQWTVYYYTRLYWQGNQYRSQFGFGDSTYNSRVTNFQYEEIP
jgi:hypothetical protein